MILYLTKVPPPDDRANAIMAIRNVLAQLGHDDYSVATAKRIYETCLSGASVDLGVVELPHVADNALKLLRRAGCDGALVPPEDEAPPVTASAPEKTEITPATPASPAGSYTAAQAALVLSMACEGDIAVAHATAKLLAAIVPEDQRAFWGDVAKTFTDTIPPTGVAVVTSG
jgi:hypothetical protein